MTKYWYAAVFIAALTAGCGSDEGEGGAGSNSTIQINPPSIDWTYTGSSFTGLAANQTYLLDPSFVTVKVLNSSGVPVRGASVLMQHDGDNTMQASDRNGSFLAFQPDPYVATTDDFGNVYVWIRTPASRAVGASVVGFSAFSGSAYQTIDITMTCTDVTTTSATLCD